MLYALKFALRYLGSSKLQTGLLVLGVAIGVFVFVFISALIGCERCVHDLTVILDMGQSAVSHQLRYLRNLRIVKRRKEGKTVYYSLDDDHIEQIFLQTVRHLEHK